MAVIAAPMTAVVLCALVVVGVLRFGSIDRQLAAMEAAEAIPDSENAAVAYLNFTATYSAPNRDGIERLIEISKIDKCGFPIPRNRQQIIRSGDFLQDMRDWHRFLNSEINNNLHRDRMREATDICACIYRMARHLRSQSPSSSYYSHGLGFDAVLSLAIKRLIMKGSTTNEHLSALRSVMPPIQDTWKQDRKRLGQVETLMDRVRLRQIGLFKRVTRSIQRFLSKDTPSPGTFESIETRYYRQLADTRGHYVLVALRQYKNETGRWPGNLDEVRESLTDEMLTDPHNGEPFFYELTDEGFRLMSTGRNGIDEGGDYKDGDDWLIWPDYWE